MTIKPQVTNRALYPVLYMKTNLNLSLSISVKLKSSLAYGCLLSSNADTDMAPLLRV